MGPAKLAQPSDQHKKIRIMLFIKKLDDISDQQFHSYWKKHHVDMAMKVEAFKDKTRRYSQVLPLRSQLKAFPLGTYST
jgi:hypothetical protein